MKNISTLLLMIVIAGCDNDTTDEVSFVTSYPTFEIKGEVWEFGEVNTGFDDPGVTVTEGGTEIEYQKIGSVDPTTPGYYPIVYTATNQDGFSGSFNRAIWIYPSDAETVDISGTYTGSFLRTSTGITYTTPGIKIEKAGIGLFKVSDLFAGYYYTRLDNNPVYLNPGYLYYTGNGELVVAPNDPDIFGDKLYGSTTLNMDGSFSLDLYDEGFDWDSNFEFVKE